MTLLEIIGLVRQISQVYNKPLTLSLEEFNLMAKAAQEELFKEFADGYTIGNGAYVDSRVSAALNPFKRARAYNFLNTVNTMYGARSNAATLQPEDYKVIAVWGFKTPNTFDSGVVEFDIVNPQELSQRLTNAITQPSFDYPVCLWDFNNGPGNTIYLIPHGFSTVNVHTLIRPTPPVLVEQITNGVRIAGSNTVELQFDSMFHTDIVRKILGYLGVSVGNGDILQVLENQNAKEK